MLKKFISVEGLDGTGKSYQVGELVRKLRELFPSTEIVQTREPGGTPVAESIRNVVINNQLNAQAQACLMTAARHTHFDELILPTISMGGIVVSDRFVDSSVLYQGFMQGELYFVRYINKPFLSEHAPGLTIMLVADLDVRVSRMGTKHKDILDDLSLKRDAQMVSVLKDYKEHFPYRKIEIVDATPDKETVAKNILSIVMKHLNEGE